MVHSWQLLRSWQSQQSTRSDSSSTSLDKQMALRLHKSTLFTCSLSFVSLVSWPSWSVTITICMSTISSDMCKRRFKHGYTRMSKSLGSGIGLALLTTRDAWVNWKRVRKTKVTMRRNVVNNTLEMQRLKSLTSWPMTSLSSPMDPGASHTWSLSRLTPLLLHSFSMTCTVRLSFYATSPWHCFCFFNTGLTRS